MDNAIAERPEFDTPTNGSKRESADALIAVSSQREVAEVQGAMTIAKRFPRDQSAACDRIMIACQRKTLAESAVYQYAKGGTDISGPSIRLAETIAREWGNLQFGIRELEQRDGESTVEAFAIDLETNVRCVKVFQCRHVRHTRNGDYRLSDPREIYELVANQGARRVRNCILGIIPGDIVESALSQCELTLKTHCDLTPERVKGMIDKFSEYKVNKEMIEARIQRRLDAITPAQFLSLGKIYNSLKDGMSSASEWFSEPTAEKAKGTSGLEQVVAKQGKKSSEVKAEDEPTPHELAQQKAAGLEQVVAKQGKKSSEVKAEDEPTPHELAQQKAAGLEQVVAKQGKKSSEVKAEDEPTPHELAQQKAAGLEQVVAKQGKKSSEVKAEDEPTPHELAQQKAARQRAERIAAEA